MKLFLLLLVTVINGCLCQTQNCPSGEDIKPCVCKIGIDKMPWVTCEGIPSLDKFRKAVNRMKGYRFSSLRLVKSDIGILPTDIFNKLEIQSLNILFTNLTSLTECLNRPPFIGLESSLESLEIRDAFTDEAFPLSRLSLSHLKKLNFLQLDGNIMPTIGNDWFETGPYGLTEVYLLNTNTKKLGSHVFESLGKLKILAITGGALTSLRRTMFPSIALSLQSLDFSNNKLSELPRDMFSKMPSLGEVFLENNEFTTISEVVWAPVWSQLHHVYFYGNPINCDKSLKWMYKYRLPEYIKGYCAAPEKLRNRELSNLTLTDFE